MKRAVIFVTRQGCTLCDEALPGVVGWAERLGLELSVVDVDASPGLLERFDHRVPVVLSSDGEVLLEGRWGGLRGARMMLRARYG
ncbi:MAG: glutaredoxin family protein [Actinomycetota bacterium]